jgi:PAS domain S-box-containing protein
VSDTGPTAPKRAGSRTPNLAQPESGPVRSARGPRLQDLLNVAEMQALLDRLHNAFDCPTAVIDTEGNVLTATAWADACTQFHRRHPLAAQECKESDLSMNEHLREGERSVTYRCPRGLVECGSPIVIDGRHLGNVFIGQVLLEEPDLEHFVAQARAFGFEEKAYLAAVSRLTVMPEAELKRRASFIRVLAETIAGMGLVRLRALEQGRQLVEAQRIARFGSFDLDTSTQRMSLSAEAADLLGLPPRSFIATLSGFWALVHPDDQARVAEAFRATLHDGVGGEVEHRLFRQTDSELRYVYQKWRPAAGGDGHMLGVVHDVTESRLAEQLLKRYELLSDQARDIILLVRREDGRILEANRAAERAYGYGRDELLARTIRDLRSDDAPQVLAGQMNAAARDGVLFETTHRRSDGSVFPVEVSSTGSIAVGDEPVLLSVVRDISERRRTEEERGTLSRMLERERDELRARQVFSRSTARISNVVNSTLSSDEIMRRVVEAAGKAFRSDSASIVLRDAEGWSVAWAWGALPGAVGRRFSPEEAVYAEQAIASRRVVPVNDCLSDGEYACGMSRYWPARAVMTVPLMVLGSAIGCLCFVFSGGSHAFTPLEVEFATSVGVRASAALGNAHLFEEQRYIARTLQESYLHPLPRIASVEMGLAVEIAHHADLIGGDVCDAFELHDGRVGALMGDVSGKGVAAAGLAAIVRSSIHALATVDASPAAVLGRTNELLLGRGIHERLVTALFMVLDQHSGEISWASAGHPPPIRLGAEDCSVFEVVSGTPLGAFPYRYSPCNAMLEPGDTIIAYTDGVTEARKDGDLFGEERLMSSAWALRHSPVQVIAEGVRDAARGFAGDLTDDAQVLAFRWLAGTAP